MFSGRKNVTENLLVDPRNIILTPLNIKLGRMKNFVKALDRNGKDLLYSKSMLPRLSEAKLKEGMSVEPDIRKITTDSKCISKLKTEEKTHDFLLLKWQNFFGKYKV